METRCVPCFSVTLFTIPSTRFIRSKLGFFRRREGLGARETANALRFSVVFQVDGRYCLSPDFRMLVLVVWCVVSSQLDEYFLSTTVGLRSEYFKVFLLKYFHLFHLSACSHVSRLGCGL